MTATPMTGEQAAAYQRLRACTSTTTATAYAATTPAPTRCAKPCAATSEPLPSPPLRVTFDEQRRGTSASAITAVGAGRGGQVCRAKAAPGGHARCWTAAGSSRPAVPAQTP
jgi:hypothetical protein